MACHKPLTAYKCADGSVVFNQLARYQIQHEILLPCGQCTGCRVDRAREWSVRCMHEAKMHDANSFLTLTYNDENIPSNGSLDYRHFQLFMKRLRMRVGPVRFFMCGEYGDQTLRPHYHALIFGYDFPDKKPWRKSANDYMLYRSAELETLWKYGNAEIGTVTLQSAGYCARYCIKKVYGDLAPSHYGEREPEFGHMSLKPGIGATFFDKFQSDIYPSDFCVADGRITSIPKYYDKLYKGSLDEIKETRELKASKHAANNVHERLAVREEVLNAKLKFLKREL